MQLARSRCMSMSRCEGRLQDQVPVIFALEAESWRMRCCDNAISSCPNTSYICRLVVSTDWNLCQGGHQTNRPNWRSHFGCLNLLLEDKSLESKPLKLHTNFRVRVSSSESKPLLFCSRSLCFFVLVPGRNFVIYLRPSLCCCSRNLSRISPIVVRQYRLDVYAKECSQRRFWVFPAILCYQSP
jgi:hypothetical protein